MNDDLNRDQKFVGQLTEIILANLENENFGVNDLAKQAGISHFVLSHKLHQAAGKTISQFIRETRLKKALEILQGGNITAAEVAYKTGFGSPTYFNTCFNEFFGYPPGSVKKQEIKNNSETKILPEVERQKQKSKIIIVSAGLIISALVMILSYHIFIRDSVHNSSDRSGLQEKSVAVLPFKNLSDSAGNQYFADGITEDILTLLSRISDLRVISRTSVEQFRDTKLSSAEIAKKLKVKYIIEGSVQKSGNRFRLWIQLIDATTGNHLWAEVYNGAYSTKIFDFQSRVAKKVAGSLNVAISTTENQMINKIPTTEILAYDLSNKGFELIRKYDLGGDAKFLQLALNALDVALQIDPDYITALLLKAQALLKSGSYDSSKVYSQKVLNIDNENTDALSVLGGYYLYTINSDSALLYFQKSIESDENNEKCFWNYLAAGQVNLCQKDEVIKALRSFQKAYDSGGDSWPEIHENISLLYSSIGDCPKAFKYMQNALSMTSSCLYVQKSFSILLAGEKYDEAIHFIDSIARITPCEQNCDIMRFHLFTILKKFDEADIFLKRAMNYGYKLQKDDYFYKYYLDKEAGLETEDLQKIKSIISSEERLLATGKSYWVSETALRVAAGYAILGDNRKAMTYFKMAEKDGFANISFPLRAFPGFDNLQNDPAYKATVDRIENNRRSLRKQVREMELRGEIHL